MVDVIIVILAIILYMLVGCLLFLLDKPWERHTILADWVVNALILPALFVGIIAASPVWLPVYLIMKGTQLYVRRK